MSSAAEPQHDPTMEEILASIRKIISEDQPLSGRKASGAAEQKDGDVLELTEEVPPETAITRTPLDAAPPVPVAQSQQGTSSVLSDSSRDAIGRAFESLDKASTEYSRFAGDMLETVFARAVQEAVAPGLQQWVNSHQAELIEAVKPMIRNWMDDHLPRLVENVLKQELGRAVSEHLRRRLT